MLSQMQANGITELRQIVRWSNIEPLRGQPQWGLYDRIALAAARHNIRLLPIVGRRSSVGEVAATRRRAPLLVSAAQQRRPRQSPAAGCCALRA